MSEIAEFAAGGVAVLVNLHGAYPWQGAAAKSNGLDHLPGKGRVIELEEQ
jgi:hypothetical protein